MPSSLTAFRIITNTAGPWLNSILHVTFLDHDLKSFVRGTPQHLAEIQTLWLHHLPDLPMSQLLFTFLKPSNWPVQTLAFSSTEHDTTPQQVIRVQQAESPQTPMDT